MGELTHRPAALSDSGRAIAPDERAERLPDRGPDQSAPAPPRRMGL